MSLPSAGRHLAVVTLHLAFVAAPLIVAGCGEGAGEPRRIRLSLILGDNSEWYQGAVKWKELVAASTGGRYQVEIIPNAASSGGDQEAELQMVRQGQLDALLVSTISLSRMEPKWTAFCFPWLFPDHATANAVCDGPVGEEMLELLRELNLVGMAYGANGFRQVTNSRRPIHTADDLKGLKIGIPQGLPPELIGHFGATTLPVAIGGRHLALERGEIQGLEDSLSAIHATKLHAVQKHVTIWNMAYEPIVLCINRDLWYALPGGDQRILRECAREAMKAQRQLVAAADEALPAKLEAEGMTVTRLSEIDRDAWRAKAQASLREQFEKIVGKDLLARFEAAVREQLEGAKAKDTEEDAQKAP